MTEGRSVNHLAERLRLPPYGLPNAFKLDWQGNATNRDRKNNEQWMADYVTSKDAMQQSLAELTGLKVKLD